MRCAKNEKTISILTYRFRQSKKADEKTGSDSNKKTKKVEGDLGHTFCKEKHTRARRRGRQESEWGEPNCVVPEFIHDDRKAHSYLPTYLHNFVCVCPRLTIRTEKKKAQQREKTNSLRQKLSKFHTSPFSTKTAEWNQILSLPNSKNSICRGDGVIEMWSSVMILHRHWLVHRNREILAL